MVGVRKRGHIDAVLFALLSMATLVLFYRFRYGADAIAFYQDDFFYYLKIASNLLHHQRSTFDGVRSTNGYHPLYLLVLTAMAWAFAGKLFFVMLQALMLLAVGLSYIAISRTFLLFTSNMILARVMAAALAYFGMMLMRGGMEVILTIPLASWLIYYLLRPALRWTARQSFYCGLLASGVVLSRLDTVLLFSLLVCFYLSWRPSVVPDKIRTICFVLLGGLPLVVYASLNVYLFHALVPISGQAKQLRTTHRLALSAFRSTFLGEFSPTRTPFTVSAALALVIGLVLVWAYGKKSRPASVPVIVALLLFPIVHMTFYSFASDWPFWPWYFYPLTLSSIAAGVVCLVVFRVRLESLSKPFMYGMAFIAGGLFLAFSLLLVRAQSPKDRDVYTNAVEIETFAKSHPGNYAMGDRAGLVGYLTSVPVLQLEGLVEDQDYLARLKAREPLDAILHEYGTDYYVGADPVLVDGCYRMTEPLQGGPTTVKTIATLCEQPEAVFNHSGFQTVIFAVPH